MGKLHVEIDHGSDHGLLKVAIAVAVMVILFGGGSAAYAHEAESGLATVAMIVGGVFLVVVVAIGGLLVHQKRSGAFQMARFGDPKATVDAIEREKRAELVRIRALRYQIEAARIAGVEITPDMIRMAEDPELAALVQLFHQAGRPSVDEISRKKPIDGP